MLLGSRGRWHMSHVHTHQLTRCSPQPILHDAHWMPVSQTPSAFLKTAHQSWDILDLDNPAKVYYCYWALHVQYSNSIFDRIQVWACSYCICWSVNDSNKHANSLEPLPCTHIRTPHNKWRHKTTHHMVHGGAISSKVQHWYPPSPKQKNPVMKPQMHSVLHWL